MTAILVEVTLGLWFLLSLLVHIPALRWLRRWVSLGGLVPNWYLFTSPLLMHDLCLRCREVDGAQNGPWREVPMSLPAQPWRWVWNPSRRLSKALLDSADAMIQARLRSMREQALGSAPFNVLLNWARRHAEPGHAVLQFCLAARTNPQGQPGHQILFLAPPIASDAATK